MIRELITDADILSGRVRSPIVLGPGVLLTPAARDRAVARGMTIREAGDERARAPGPGAAATSSGAGAAGCARCGAASCACGGGAGCAPSTGGLPAPAGAHGSALPERLADGVYLLRVEGGRVVSLQPGSGPGQMTRSRHGAPTP